MNDGPVVTQAQRRQVLLTIRIIWAAILAGPIVFLAVLLLLLFPSHEPSAHLENLNWILFAIACVMVVTLLPATYFIRSQLYKRGWHGDAVSPNTYFTANLILFGACESIVLFGLVTVFVACGLWPYILPIVIACVVHVLNFPHGRPMAPAQNVFNTPPPQ